MSIIPKKTKFRLSFRNKLKTHDRKVSVFNQLSKLCKSTNAWHLLTKKKINAYSGVDDFYKSSSLTICKNPVTFVSSTLTKKTNVKQNNVFQKLNYEEQIKNEAQLFFTPNAKKNAWVAHWPNSFELQLKKINFKVTNPCLHFSKHNLLNVKSVVTCYKQSNSLQQTTQLLVKQQMQQNFAYSFQAHAYNSCLLFGQYGICFEQNGTLSAKFIETVRLICARKLKKKGRCWLRICCQTAVTARPAETRMGKGKGTISFWQAKVYTGQMFFEFSGLSQSTLNEIFNKFCKKSPLKLKLITV